MAAIQTRRGPTLQSLGRVYAQKKEKKCLPVILNQSKGKDEAMSVSTTMKKHHISGRHGWNIDYIMSLLTP